MCLFYSAKAVVRKRNKPSFEEELLPATAVVPCGEGERWTRFGEYVGWGRDNDEEIFENLRRFWKNLRRFLENLRRFWKNLRRFLENLRRFWRNVRGNFFFVGPFLEPFVEGFEREEMADER